VEAFRKVLREGTAVRVPSFTFQPHASVLKYFSVTISPLKNSKEKTYAAVGIFHDITELKRTEQIRIDFVANVSHELRTPLTLIKGYVDTIALDSKENLPAHPEHLQIIQKNTQRLLTLIEDLLDLSVIESRQELDQKQGSLQSISLEEITAQALAPFQEKTIELGLKLRTSIEAKELFGEPSRIEQVLTNLIDNAVKYTPSRGEIEIRWKHRSDQGIQLEVWNSGPGIPSQYLSRLFERFYRADLQTDSGRGSTLGTGLGLAIVKHIVHNHGGKTWVESAPGEGVTFYCSF
jgi:two-component system phosphate regulon sensor histidine kinase PhoR